MTMHTFVLMLLCAISVVTGCASLAANRAGTVDDQQTAAVGLQDNDDVAVAVEKNQSAEGNINDPVVSWILAIGAGACGPLAIFGYILAHRSKWARKAIDKAKGRSNE